MFFASELIKKKKTGGEHTLEEIQWLIKEFTNGAVPDYQMAAWAMAVWFNGMSSKETAALTLAMRDSGERIKFKNITAPRVDKHSTGGVGDKTSLIIGPLLAAAKIHVPMIAGRGLGHTGGTLDKLESIPGFNVNLTKENFISLVEKEYFSLMGQTSDICPADKKFYALRDVTSTVDSLPLICGSIMSKKLAEDLTGLVLDVKFGSGAFMKTVEEARALAKLLKSAGEENGVRVIAVLSNMHEPLGRFAGNALEVKECLDIMSNKKCVLNGFDFYEPTRELSLVLTAYMIVLAGVKKTFQEAKEYAEHLLTSGKALEQFEKFVRYQGPGDLSQLPKPQATEDVLSPRSGYLHSIDTERVGLACIALGAGRVKSSDTIDPISGVETLCRAGWTVEKGQPLFRLHGRNNKNFASASEMLLSAIKISDSSLTHNLPFIAEVLT